MFCGECGTQNPDTNQFCKNCGKPLRKPQQAPAVQPVVAPVPPIPAQPQTQPAYYPPQPSGYSPAAAVPTGLAGGEPKPPLNKGLLVLGIIGLILAIVSWFFYPYICGIAAVVLGGITFYKAEKKAGIVGIIGVLAILVGLASMLVDNFYFILFPPQEIVITLLSVVF